MQAQVLTVQLPFIWSDLYIMLQRVPYSLGGSIKAGLSMSSDLYYLRDAKKYCSAVGSFDVVNLGGYGVELALRNVEYKAMDDSQIKEDCKTEELSRDVRGFISSKILERKPELTSEVMAFRDYLSSSTISDTLEIWELKGHQTSQRILHAANPL